MALYKPISVYIFGRSETEMGAEVGAEIEEAIGVKVKMPLLLIRALLASLSLSVRARLW